jgi:hypothetical protein
MKLYIALLISILLLSACRTIDSSARGLNANQVNTEPQLNKNDHDPIQEALFHEWFAAEFDNHEQNWQDKIDLKENPDLQVHEHIHHIFAPLPTPALEGTTYFVKQYINGDSNNLYRQRLYQFVRKDKTSLLELKIFRFIDEKKFADAHLNPQLYQNLQLEDLISYSGCEVYWAYKLDDNKAGYFDGYMHHNNCVTTKR